MRNIENSYLFTDRSVLSQNSCPWILNRHQPTAKIGHLGISGLMLIV
jgi:hypothetical protein